MDMQYKELYVHTLDENQVEIFGGRCVPAPSTAGRGRKSARLATSLQGIGNDVVSLRDPCLCNSTAFMAAAPPVLAQIVRELAQHFKPLLEDALKPLSNAGNSLAQLLIKLLACNRLFAQQSIQWVCTARGCNTKHHVDCAEGILHLALTAAGTRRLHYSCRAPPSSGVLTLVPGDLYATASCAMVCAQPCPNPDWT